MFKRLLKPQIIKRFCHTHSKTVIKENKKTNAELIINELSEINSMLLRIEDETKVTHFLLFWIGLIITFKNEHSRL